MKAIIFDMDGVLIQSMQYHVIACQQALNQYQIFPNEAEIFLLEGMPGQDTINLLVKKYSSQLSLEARENIYALKKKLVNKTLKIKFYPGVLSLLKTLKEHKITLALVTGSNKEFLDKAINNKIKELFQAIITCEDVKNGKPFPDPYLVALEKINMNPDDVVVIENAPMGIESSKRAGLKTFALTTTLEKKYLKKADRIFHNHKELIDFFRKKLMKQNKN